MRGSVATLHSMDYRRFLVEVVALRRRAGLTQRELARRLGQSPSYVAKSEMGERRLDVLELLAICRACGEELTSFVARLQTALLASGDALLEEEG